MEDFSQEKNNLLIKIEELLEKLAKFNDDRYIVNRDQIYLVVSNLKNIVSSCDERFLVKNIRDSISNNISSINGYINNNNSNNITSPNVQSYLYTLIQMISFLNNSRGKQSLQGYQQAVNKNIRLLEEDILRSRSEVKKLEEEISKETEEVERIKKDFSDSIISSSGTYENKMLELNKKYEDFTKDIFEEQRKIKTIYDEQLLDCKDQISKIKLDLTNATNKALIDFEKDKTDKLEELSKNISNIIDEKEKQLADLMDSATDKIGKVAASTFSNAYEKYSNKAKNGSRLWYAGAIFSMLALVGVSIWWFVFTEYSNTDYIALIAKVVATVGIAVISRYCALQASKNKVIETKLRKIQLQMRTFDAFVASLEKAEQDKVKIELTNKLIEQGDWLNHDKDEVDITTACEKIISKTNKN